MKKSRAQSSTLRADVPSSQYRGFQGRASSASSWMVVWGGWPGVLAAALQGCRREHARPSFWARTKYTAHLELQKEQACDGHVQARVVEHSACTSHMARCKALLLLSCPQLGRSTPTCRCLFVQSAHASGTLCYLLLGH